MGKRSEQPEQRNAELLRSGLEMAIAAGEIVAGKATIYGYRRIYAGLARVWHRLDLGGVLLPGRTVVAVGSRQRPDRHSQVSGGLPRIDSALQQPRCARVAQGVGRHALAEAGLGDCRWPRCRQRARDLPAVEVDDQRAAGIVEAFPAS